MISTIVNCYYGLTSCIAKVYCTKMIVCSLSHGGIDVAVKVTAGLIHHKMEVHLYIAIVKPTDIIMAAS